MKLTLWYDPDSIREAKEAHEESQCEALTLWTAQLHPYWLPVDVEVPDAVS